MVSITEVIDDYPEDRLYAIREGFSALAKIKPEHRDEVFRLVSNTMATAASNIDLEPLSDASGLSSSLLRPAVNAVTGIINIASEGDFQVEDFLAAAAGKLFDEVDAPVAAPIVERALSGAQNWRANLARRRLAVETLPAFLSLDVSIDLRFRFAKDKITDATPVLILHVDTDTDGKEIWLQATRGDIQLILDRLTRAARQLEQAEQFYLQHGSARQE
jgi:hypothetical protein